MYNFSKLDKPAITTLLFSGKNHDVESSSSDNMQRIPVAVDSGHTLEGRFLGHGDDAPTLLFFPSPGKSIDACSRMAGEYNRRGLNFAVVSYRDESGDTAGINVSSFFADGVELFQQTERWLNEKGCNGPVFLKGEGLGAVLVLDLMCQHGDKIKGMILDSAIGDTLFYLRSLGVDEDNLDFGEEDGFDNLNKIEGVKNPTLIFHGSRDTLVPAAEAEKLQSFSGARTKQFFVVPGGERENLCEAGGHHYFDTVKKFIDTVCGANTWRQRRKKYRDREK
ncbi:alpha/beta hydrolase [Desulforhopalus singaporensis]|uniref:Alpha/beta hydrolase n=1 Tax=Desulforhopalus singaporensis TaxID=91360 RepID=A0A1H0QHZ1_9BACT|nr:hypothetical protein [Desulforhopalus singaporensis]SDP16820.1 hypothetical protein SAMN05660330_01968 [Desulforhopalus singaporensis]